MKIKTPTTKLALVAGLLGVIGFGSLAPSASAAPRRGSRSSSTTTTRTRTVTRNNSPVVVNRNQTTVINRSRPIVVNRNRPVVINRTRTVTRRTTTNRNRYTNQNSTWNGRVTYVSGSRFGVNIGGSIYNVLPSSALPRGLSRNDYVQVTGVRTGSTIRSNRVYITRNA